MNVEQLSQNLNLSQNQALIYYTLLQMGSGRIQEIAAKSRLIRTTTYSLLDSLIKKGFVTMVKKAGHREYFAENPQNIPNILDNEVQKLIEQKNKVTSALPELASLYNIHATKPKIRFYEGLDGLKQIFNETLELNKGEEILAYSSAASIHEYLGDEYVRQYLNRRVKKGIIQRAIAEDSPAGREHRKNDKQELRKTKLVDANKFPFSNEINIFKNKMIIMSYKDLLGVVIESSEIARTQKAIFELAWLGAKQ